MRRLVDSSAWIEWLIGSEVGAEIDLLLPPVEDWVVPTIVQFELAKWIGRESDDPMQLARTMAFSEQCAIVPLTSELALAAARASADHQLSAADAIVYATALAVEADLLTCDRHFASLPHVVLRPKGQR